MLFEPDSDDVIAIVANCANQTQSPCSSASSIHTYLVLLRIQLASPKPGADQLALLIGAPLLLE